VTFAFVTFRVITDNLPGTRSREGEQVLITEDLELLADLVTDLGVVGIKFCQGVGESEFHFT
jgi:hypothetical protein